MAFAETTWYCNAGDQATTGHYAVAQWAANAPIAAGALRRQLAAPAVGSERVFVCIVAGTTSNPTEPTWVLTRGAKTTDNTVTWQECTGNTAVNGDLTNTLSWATIKAIPLTPSLGVIIKRNSGTSYQICTTSGSLGASEPAFSDTAGTTTSESGGTAVWTSLGVVGNFAAWSAPHARLANACASTWYIAGNTIYVADNHAESQATAITITPASVLPNFGKILCVNHLGSMPPVVADLTTGAVVATTATNVSITYSGGGAYIYGLTIKAGLGVSSGANNILLTSTGGTKTVFDNCSFWLSNSTAANVSLLSVGGSTNTTMIWNNCTIKYAVVTNSIAPGTMLWRWQNTGQVLVAGSAVPTNFIKFGGNVSNVVVNMVFEALDLSQLTGSLDTFNTANNAGVFQLVDCKLNASMTVSQPNVPGNTFQFIRSDSGATAYLSTRYQYEGTETTETSITRVGGAVDPTGQAQSRKIVTTANVQFVDPFNAEAFAIWNSATAATVTATIYGTINSASLPNNDELWAELEYLGTASFPLGNLLTSAKATILTASGATGLNANITTDGSTWNGGGSGGGWTPFKIQFLLNTANNPQPQFAGYIIARVKAAKATTTYYIDPQLVLS